MDESAAAGRRQRFGHQLGEALDARGFSYADLAARVSSTAAEVSTWVHGQVEPPAGDLFVVERVLAVPAGRLCAFLGYLPTSELRIEEVVRATPEIEDDLRPMLLAAVRELIKHSQRSRGLRSVPRPPS